MRLLLLSIISIILIVACADPVAQYETLKGPAPLPAEDHFYQRNYPDVKFNHQHYFKTMDKAIEESYTRSIQGTWVDQGPGNIGGRINSMAVHPTNEDIMYMGFGRGGLYKTIDGGNNWTSVFNEFTFLSISHISIDQNNPEIVYIGTGDENISGYPQLGRGVYKTEDGGTSWQNIGLQDETIISEVYVAPTNSDILYASAMGLPMEKNNDRGVYKSINGGQDWSQSLFINDSTGVIDIAVDPTNPDIVYAAGWNRLRSDYASKISGPDARIWKTTDGGENWNILGNGLPEGNITRIGLDMLGDNSDVMVACYSASLEFGSCGNSGNQFYGIYMTEDGGDTWYPLPTDEEFNGLQCGFQGGFAWYFGQVRINPNNIDDITILGVTSWRTLDRGQSWFPLVTNGNVHVDYHELLYHNDKIYVGTDGGGYSQQGDEFSEWFDIENISTNQFYRVAVNPHRPDQYFGGLQDNGSVGGSAQDINSWRRYYGGDGFQMAFHPEDQSIWLAEYQRGGLSISYDEGESFEWFATGLDGTKNWDMPYILSPHNPYKVIAGSDRLYERTIFVDEEFVEISPVVIDESDDNPFFQRTISTISESPIREGIIYAGTSDGQVMVGHPVEGWRNISEGLPNRYITSVKASEVDENRAYVTLSGFKLNDNETHVYRTDDLGDTWIDISGDLPKLPINDLVIMPNTDEQVLFVGSNSGVYYTEDAGDSWDRLGDNLPFIPVYDMEYQVAKNYLVAGTFGKGLQTFDLEQVGIGLESSNTDLVETTFDVYPTVTDGIINIVNTLPSKRGYRLIDASGALVRTIDANARQIDVSAVAGGMYYLIMEDNQGGEVRKIVKM